MSKGTARRSIRVGALWEEAQQVANRRGENLSEIIRQALAQYVQDNPPRWQDRWNAQMKAAAKAEWKEPK